MSSVFCQNCNLKIAVCLFEFVGVSFYNVVDTFITYNIAKVDDKMFVIDGQTARAIRGYVDILSPLASRMVEFDLDADAEKLVEDVQAFCAQLTSACSLGQPVDFEGIEWEYLKFRLEMDYFIAAREDAVVPKRTGDDAEVHERTDDGVEVHEGTDDDWILC